MNASTAAPGTGGSTATPRWVDAAQADTRTLRDLFGAFLTGVTVVTLRDSEGSPRGFTANSFTSVSLDPPLVLVCVGRHANSHDALCDSTRFGISILAERQRDASNAFARSSGPKFDAVAAECTPAGTPLVDGSLAMLECQREQLVPAGDHTIVIGRVLNFARSTGQPLGFHGGGYVAFGLGATALERLGGEAIRIGCLLECHDRVLLCRRPGEVHWRLPDAALQAGQDHRSVLPTLLAACGVQADVSFLYSVYQDAQDAHTTLLFRGTAAAPPDGEHLADGTELRLFAREDQPWTRVAGSSPAQVLQRYFREQEQARFGIYWDTRDGGRIAYPDAPAAPWQTPVGAASDDHARG